MRSRVQAIWLVAIPLVAAGGCVPTPPGAPVAVNITPKPANGSVEASPTSAQPAATPGKPAEEKPPATESITWERLDIRMEPDSVYQPWMLTTDIKVLEGKPVRIK